MKSLLCVTAIFLCSYLSAFGQSKTDQPTDKIIDQPILELPKFKREKPRIEMQKALKIMEKYLEKEKIDTTNFYISQVKMIQYGSANNTQPAWYFWWVNIDGSLGNYIEIAVFMDGSILRMPSM